MDERLLLIPERWFWISEWCKKNGLPPHDHAVWKQGEDAYEKHKKESNQ